LELHDHHSLQDLPYVDRFELNVSCPNTHAKSGAVNAREENLRMLDAMLNLAETYARPQQEIYFKVSPNSTQEDVDDTADIAKKYRVTGIVTTNTSTKHDKRYIPVSPKVNGKQVGGASGNAVHDESLETQKLYDAKRRELGQDWKLIACGGVNSFEKVAARLEHGAVGIQVYTPLVFSGPKLVRQLRAYKD